MFSIKETCPKCNLKSSFVRRVSFLDGARATRHSWTTAIAASSIIDGAILVIAAKRSLPATSAAEHLTVLDILGIKNLVIGAGTRIDLVSKEKAMLNYQQIKPFSKARSRKTPPIIPIAAHYGTNLDALIEAIQEFVPTPKRDITAPPKNVRHPFVRRKQAGRRTSAK